MAPQKGATGKAVRLVARADDLGIVMSANFSIVSVLDAGLVRNASLIAPALFAGHAAELLAHRREFCIGLHATVNSEWDNLRWGPSLPPADVPSLVDGGGYLCQTTREQKERGIDPRDIMREVVAQLSVARRMGFDIRYADTHMGWTWMAEGLTELFDSWCRKEGLVNGDRAVPPLPGGTEPGGAEPGGTEPGGYAGPLSADGIRARLAAAPPGACLLVGHPGNDDAEMRALGHEGYPGERVAAERDGDRRALSDPGLIAWCRESGVVPIRFDEI